MCMLMWYNVWKGIFIKIEMSRHITVAVRSHLVYGSEISMMKVDGT